MKKRSFCLLFLGKLMMGIFLSIGLSNSILAQEKSVEKIIIVDDDNTFNTKDIKILIKDDDGVYKEIKAKEIQVISSDGNSEVSLMEYEDKNGNKQRIKVKKENHQKELEQKSQNTIDSLFNAQKPQISQPSNPDFFGFDFNQFPSMDDFSFMDGFSFKFNGKDIFERDKVKITEEEFEKLSKKHQKQLNDILNDLQEVRKEKLKEQQQRLQENRKSLQEYQKRLQEQYQNMFGFDNNMFNFDNEFSESYSFDGYNPNILQYIDKKDKPLILLNGKEFEGKLEDIDKSTIDNITIHKGSNVIKEYGDRAKDGVIIITQKTFEGQKI